MNPHHLATNLTLFWPEPYITGSLLVCVLKKMCCFGSAGNKEKDEDRDVLDHPQSYYPCFQKVVLQYCLYY